MADQPVRRLSQLADCHLGGPKRPIGPAKQMAVMSKEQHLRRLHQLGQHLKAHQRAIVVVIDEEVVRQEWQLRAPRDGVLHRSQTQRQKR